MKKIALFLLLGILVLFPVGACGDEPARRGLFVSMIDDPPVFSSRSKIMELIRTAKFLRVKVLFVQIYRANESLFPSVVADPGPYEKYKKDVPENPFALLIQEAHASEIQVYAWANLLSLSENKGARLLKKYGTSILTRNMIRKRTVEDYKIDNQYFLEPGDLRVRGELAGMVAEILKAYPELDGLLFDYIRYPDKDIDCGYTAINIKRFKKASGRETVKNSDTVWKDWKRAQVTETLEHLVKKARGIRPNIRISATGCAPYGRAYDEAYQDWPSWLERGLVDFVTVMSYSADTTIFNKYVREAKSKVINFGKVNIGIGAYKLTESPDIFAEQFKSCETSGCGSCVIFHYGSFAENNVLELSLIEQEKRKAP